MQAEHKPVSETLFISDLHLDARRPEITALFLALLLGRARSAEHLYILGDLFEAWLGDDDASELAQTVVEALHELTTAGVPVSFIHGNRDFLVGSTFAQDTGCQVIVDQCIINLYRTPTLILHGDTLCTDDIEYQKFRSMVRNPDWQQTFLAKPLAERIAIAQQLREVSKDAVGEKSADIMDVNPKTVQQTFLQQNVRQMIHGHTHRPNVHLLEIDGEPYTRYVLGDWYEQGSILSCTASGCKLERLPLS